MDAWRTIKTHPIPDFRWTNCRNVTWPRLLRNQWNNRQHCNILPRSSSLVPLSYWSPPRYCLQYSVAKTLIKATLPPAYCNSRNFVLVQWLASTVFGLSLCSYCLPSIWGKTVWLSLGPWSDPLCIEMQTSQLSKTSDSDTHLTFRMVNRVGPYTSMSLYSDWTETGPRPPWSIVILLMRNGSQLGMSSSGMPTANRGRKRSMASIRHCLRLGLDFGHTFKYSAVKCQFTVE